MELFEARIAFLALFVVLATLMRMFQRLSQLDVLMKLDQLQVCGLHRLAVDCGHNFDFIAFQMLI